MKKNKNKKYKNILYILKIRRKKLSNMGGGRWEVEAPNDTNKQKKLDLFFKEKI